MMTLRVLIPHKDIRGDSYPNNIKPGSHDLVALLRANAENPEAIRFIASMLES